MIFKCRNLTMSEFAEQVRHMGRQGRFWSPLPVVDETGLAGGWDFELQYDIQLTSIDDNTYLSQTLEKQVGLKLEDIRIPAPMVEVQSVDRAPTPNPADLANIIPPLPTEFDAAEIKPADLSPDARQTWEFKNGSVFIPQVTVKYLVTIAWDVRNSDIVGLPKWAESDPLDLVAKAPPEVSLENSNILAQTNRIDFEPLRPMLRNLLIERYQLRVHTEERPAPAWALLAAKPKLKPADPSARTACHDGAPTDSTVSNANSALGRLVTCQNMTMAQFAELLPLVDPEDLQGAVIDATDVAGAWQFSFNFVALRQIRAAALNRGGESSDGATDPAGRYSIFDAVSKQLGLKLESSKRPMPVLVVDHIER